MFVMAELGELKFEWIRVCYYGIYVYQITILVLRYECFSYMYLINLQWILNVYLLVPWCWILKCKWLIYVLEWVEYVLILCYNALFFHFVCAGVNDMWLNLKTCLLFYFTTYCCCWIIIAECFVSPLFRSPLGLGFYLHWHCSTFTNYTTTTNALAIKSTHTYYSIMDKNLCLRLLIWHNE